MGDFTLHRFLIFIGGNDKKKFVLFLLLSESAWIKLQFCKFGDLYNQFLAFLRKFFIGIF